MRNEKSLFLNALLVLVVMFAFTAQAYAGGKVYKIGACVGITGPTADAGNPYAKGIEDYFKFVNETKMLGDDTIDCTIRDDQYKTDITKRNFEEYLDMGIVLYLNYSTGSSLALKRDFDEVQIPTITASFHRGNLKDSKYMFLPIASYSEQTVVLAEYVANNHKGGDKPKVALFHHGSAFGRGPLADVQKAVELGLNIELVELVAHGKDLDNSAMLKRFLAKGIQYVICQTVQSPVATMLKDAKRLGVTAKEFGEKGKLTFLGAAYTGGADLIDLAGDATDGYLWTCSWYLTNEENEGTKKQLALAKLFGRDKKAANSHNYGSGIQVAQIVTEVILRAKKAGLEVNRANLYKMLLGMNGDNSFTSYTSVAPVTYSPTDHAGVDPVQIYRSNGKEFTKFGTLVQSEYMKKIQ
ncbi:MAG: ABC transporter substrate-binding protein [Desulfobacula sp.]|nr:ABC transporter substrate-binding protein [Desulfobacula sp.]